jgi:hypothetical protein
MVTNLNRKFYGFSRDTNAVINEVIEVDILIFFAGLLLGVRFNLVWRDK